ncbi:UNVERIFIED_ORG: hypothetical protein QOE_4426 [Clostridioides difficile F501]
MFIDFPCVVAFRLDEVYRGSFEKGSSKDDEPLISRALILS